MRYAVVTPVRDEAANLPRLALSILTQTLRPAQWIIVDTGSSDETLPLVHRLCSLRPWIVRDAIIGPDLPTRGGPVVDALHQAFTLLATNIDVVVKVDADVSFAEDHLEQLVGCFLADLRLGIASGCREEFERGRWRKQGGTATTVEAQLRAYRYRCLTDVLPLERRMGWDVVDESAAVAQGWRTDRFQEICFRHHRRVGARDRSRREAWRAQGEIAHYVGYRTSYLLARACFRAARDPSAWFMASSFVNAKLTGRPKSSHAAARATRRSQQRLRHLPGRLNESVIRTPPPWRELGPASLLLCSDVGGHLLELYTLADSLPSSSRVWVTMDASDSRELLARERVCFVDTAGRRSVIAFAKSLVTSWRIVSAVRPRVAITTGSPRAVPLLWAAKLRGARVVFVECAGRVRGESLSRRLVAPIADRTYVQWPEQADQRKRARYAGTACFGHTQALTARLVDLPLFDEMDVVVTVGTCEFPFDRLLHAVEAAAGVIGPSALVQTGTSGYRPAGVFAVDFVAPSVLYGCFRRAKHVVCHAGIGSVALALAAGHRPIVMPRRRGFGEQRDDHQIEFAYRLAGLGLASVVESANDLERALQQPNLGPCTVTATPDLGVELRDFVSECLGGVPRG